MEDYSKYQAMNFKKKHSCPGEIWQATCWSCAQFEYCINRELILNNAGLTNLEYPSPDIAMCYEIRGTFEPGRFSLALDATDNLPMDRGDIYSND